MILIMFPKSQPHTDRFLFCIYIYLFLWMHSENIHTVCTMHMNGKHIQRHSISLSDFLLCCRPGAMNADRQRNKMINISIQLNLFVTKNRHRSFQFILHLLFSFVHFDIVHWDSCILPLHFFLHHNSIAELWANIRNIHLFLFTIHNNSWRRYWCCCVHCICMHQPRIKKSIKSILSLLW